MQIALLLRASDPGRGFGEVLRLSNSLVLSLLPSGGLQLWLASEGADPVTLRSAPLPLLNGRWHRLEVTFDGGRNRVSINADGRLAAQGEAGARLRPDPDLGLSLGAQGKG
ncbi:LamG domain-containing protein, partial [Thioclava sp. BHET1]